MGLRHLIWGESFLTGSLLRTRGLDLVDVELEKKLAELLAKKTSFKPVENMESSRVSKTHTGYLSSLGLSETGKSVAECKRHLIEQHCLGQSAHSSWSLLLCAKTKRV
jgi:hypothetical protein